MVINYAHLARAIEWYAYNGYTQIEVDWIVPYYINQFTNPNPYGNFVTIGANGEDFALVGSAEQGFLKAIVDGRIEPDKKYMSVSPCFRRGDTGPINQEWFVKLELSVYSKDNPDWFKLLGDDAMELFNELDGYNQTFSIEDESHTPTAFDIVGTNSVHSGVEVGSYGVREINGLTSGKFLLHYGTGLALPRFQLFSP